MPSNSKNPLTFNLFFLHAVLSKYLVKLDALSASLWQQLRGGDERSLLPEWVLVSEAVQLWLGRRRGSPRPCPPLALAELKQPSSPVTQARASSLRVSRSPSN